MITLLQDILSKEQLGSVVTFEKSVFIIRIHNPEVPGSNPGIDT